MIHDVHTHRLPPNPEEAIVCCRYSDFPLAIQQEATYLSVGIHPWYLTQEDIQLQLEWLNNRLQDQRIIAIGESGLDKCCRTPLDLQLEAFEKQTARSESLHLPMILHVVRAYQEIIACRKNLRACQPWIIHGFRGKKEVARTLLDQGFYLSFGQKFQPETLRYVPEDRLLLETDESLLPIREIYQEAASTRETTVEQLEKAVSSTINKLFFSR